MRKALVLLNMGGPNDLGEVELFLKNMFNDPNILTIKSPLLRRLVASLIVAMRKKEAVENYRKLGGKSPLVELTKKLADKLAARLPDTHVTFAMRYTPPFADAAIAELKSQGTREVTLLPLYPHYSTTTTKSSLEDFYARAKEAGFGATFKEIGPFFAHPRYNDALLERIDEAMEGADAKEYTLIFSAHSLPQRIVDRGDPYLSQVQEHVELLKKRLGERFGGYELAFQSKLGPVKWLEPALDETLQKFAGKKVLVVPISFILDNSETLFELHREYGELAKEAGLADYRVAKCPNDSDTFAQAIEELYESA
jgi:ferrochelatase